MTADTLGYRIPLFGREVYAERRGRASEAVGEADLDVMLVTVPENIYYLVGLDHFGYFAFHALIVTAQGECVLVARRIERVTIGRDVPDVRFEGYDDEEDVAAHCIGVVRSVHQNPARIGLEESSLYLTPAVAEGIRSGFPDSEVVDASEVVSRHRLVQSPEELETTRRVAAVSDAMLSAAIATAAVGVTEREVAAAALAAMMEAGGEPPAFWPFVRGTARLNEDHTTWTDYPLRPGDALFLELSGSIGRYHAPMGRVVFVGEIPAGAEVVAGVCLEAFEATLAAGRAGARAGDVYGAWQATVDAAGFSHYRRHHCGYATGIGFPPSWSGGGVPRALRPGSGLVLVEGMVFHLISWMMGTGRGDYFVSDPVEITAGGAVRLTTTPQVVSVACLK